MNGRFFRQGVIAVAIATAVAGASTVAALATIPDSGGVIHGCYQKNVGNLRVIDTATDSCRPSEIATAWSQTGPAGPQGPQGAQGAQGPTGASGLSHAYFVVEDPFANFPISLTALPDGFYTISATVDIFFRSCTLCIGTPLAQCVLLASGGVQPFADGVLAVHTGDIFGGTLFAQASFTEAIHLTKGPGVNSILIVCSSARDASGRARITALAVDALN
jgi:hypothetical protein